MPNLPRITYTRIGNQKLRTAVWKGLDKGEGKRTPLLFFNGIGANLEIAQTFADAFTGRDIITFDMPGVGGSPDPVLPYRPWWVASAAKKILKLHGYNKVDVLGVSWGGGMAQQFAFQNQSMTNRLVLCATTSGVTMIPGDIRSLSKMGSPKRYKDKDYLAKHFETLYGEESEGAPEFAKNMIAPSIKGYLYQLMCMAGWSSLPFLRLLKMPTLIIMGGKDRIVPVANGKILKFMIKGAKMHVFDDGGHLFLLSRRDASIAVIREFFNEPEVDIPVKKPAPLAPLPTQNAA